METIKDTVQHVLRMWEVKRKEPLKDNPGVLLKKIFTKKELGHVKFNYFRNGTLNLNVDSSSWLYHLSLKKEKLLTKLREGSKAEIKDIRFFVGEIQQ